MNNVSIGKRGEELARRYFNQRGYDVADQNFRTRYGEIDLILRKNKSYRFVEVKFRRTLEYGLPQESVIRKKQRKIHNTALAWLKLHYLPLDCDLHFDVLAISEASGKIEFDYLEDAF